MKRLILLAATVLVSTCGFANEPATLSKNSPQLKALGSAWKATQGISLKDNKNDITIVYGGEDISRRYTIVSHTATA